MLHWPDTLVQLACKHPLDVVEYDVQTDRGRICCLAVQLFYLRIHLAFLSGDVFRVSPQETVCVGGRHTFFVLFHRNRATFNTSSCQTL